MSDVVFVDTNILIYAHDVDAGAQSAVELPRSCDNCGSPVPDDCPYRCCRSSTST